MSRTRDLPSLFSTPYHPQMPLNCNIDARGKLARFVWGLLCLLTGIVLLLAWAIPAGGWLAWTLTLLTIAFGGLGLFEARAGWCVVRAMGFRTRL